MKQQRLNVIELATYKTEDDIQKEVATWLDYQLPKDWRWYHTPNGGQRNPATAGRLKAAGVKPGVADIIICRPSGPDIWIELKAHKGVLSDAQKDWRDWMNACGRPYFVARSLGEVIGILKEFLGRAA